MKDGQGKSPVSEFLAEHETGLGFESLQYRLQRYGAGKARALDMADYITDFVLGNRVCRWTSRLEAKRIAASMGIVVRICFSGITSEKMKCGFMQRLSARSTCFAHSALCAGGRSTYNATWNVCNAFWRKIRACVRLWLL